VLCINYGLLYKIYLIQYGSSLPNLEYLPSDDSNISNFLEDFQHGIFLSPTGPHIEKDLLRNDVAAMILITNHFVQRYNDYNITLVKTRVY
jgi:hypothetical protein